MSSLNTTTLQERHYFTGKGKGGLENLNHIFTTIYLEMLLGNTWEDKNTWTHADSHTHSFLKTSKVKGTQDTSKPLT